MSNVPVTVRDEWIMTRSRSVRSRCQQTAVLLAAGAVAVLVSGWLVSSLRTTSGPAELVFGTAVTALVVATQVRYLRRICTGWPALSRRERWRTGIEAVVVPLVVVFLLPVAIVAGAVALASRIRSAVGARAAAHRTDGRREPITAGPVVPEQRRCSPTSIGDVPVG